MPTAKPQRKITFENEGQLKQAQDDVRNAGVSLSAWLLSGRGYETLQRGGARRETPARKKKKI